MKVYCVGIDGNHIGCFETEREAAEKVRDLHLSGFRYAEYEEGDYDENCDCKNENILKGINHASS